MRTIRSLAVLSALALTVAGAAGCSSDKKSDGSTGATRASAPAAPAGPQQYSVIVDGPSTLGAENIAYGTYFPKTLAVRPGDSVVFENRSSHDVHTVTLGVKADRSDQPPPVMKNGEANPAVFGPCYDTAGSKPNLTCPAPPAAAPEYTGQGFWNSGVILSTAHPAAAGPKSTTLKLAAGIAPGSYTIVCLLHPFMSSTLQVVGRDAERQPAAAVAAAADRELGAAKAEGAAIPAPTHAPSATGASVSAGWGDNLVNFNRFDPETVTVKAGQTVMWRDTSTWTPHTVSFSPPFKSEAEPGALKPVGAKLGSSFAGGVAHSGIFGPSPPFPGDSFSLKFTKAGTYPYFCLLHPGMAGTIKVE